MNYHTELTIISVLEMSSLGQVCCSELETLYTHSTSCGLWSSLFYMQTVHSSLRGCGQQSSCSGLNTSLYHALLSSHGQYCSNLFKTWFLTELRVDKVNMTTGMSDYAVKHNLWYKSIISPQGCSHCQRAGDYPGWVSKRGRWCLLVLSFPIQRSQYLGQWDQE